MNKTLLALILAGSIGAALADEPAAAPAPAAPSWLKKDSPKVVEKIVRKGLSCFKETTTTKMVESCYDGKTYYSPISETASVKIACPKK